MFTPLSKEDTVLLALRVASYVSDSPLQDYLLPLACQLEVETELYQLKLRQMSMWGFSNLSARSFDYEYACYMQDWIKMRAARDTSQSGRGY